MIADWEYRIGNQISVLAISAATGISRETLSKVLNHKGANISIENIAKICRFLEYEIEELVELTDNKNID